MSELFICHIFYSNNFSHGQSALNIDICCFVKYCSWFKKRQKWQVCGKCVANVWQMCGRCGWQVCGSWSFQCSNVPGLSVREGDRCVRQLIVLVCQLCPVCVSVNVAGVLFQRGS